MSGKYAKYLASFLSLNLALSSTVSGNQAKATREFKSHDSEFLLWAEKLIEESSKKQISALEGNMKKERKCSMQSENDPDPELSHYPKLLGFVSFSMPIDALLDLSLQLKMVDGAFVIRGLPENSFKLLAKKIFELRKKGAIIPVFIDPKAFELYNVQVVPAFVLFDGDKCDKIVGNISVESALNIFAEKGEVEESKHLLSLYRKEIK